MRQPRELFGGELDVEGSHVLVEILPTLGPGNRHHIVTVRQQGTTFVGERDSLVTKCPSKFEEAPGATTPGGSGTAPGTGSGGRTGV